MFNVACGERISINDLWDTLKIAADSAIAPIYGSTRQGDVKDSLADISKAEQLLGYSPRISVREGLKLTWDWFNKT